MYLERKRKDAELGGHNMQEVGYWRKANQIREWFATHLEGGVENCEYSKVTEDDLLALRLDCMKAYTNHELAPEILPTSSGFFFGSTAYDDWYFEDLSETIDIINNVLDTTDWENEEIYYYEWW